MDDTRSNKKLRYLKSISPTRWFLIIVLTLCLVIIPSIFYFSQNQTKNIPDGNVVQPSKTHVAKPTISSTPDRTSLPTSPPSTPSATPSPTIPLILPTQPIASPTHIPLLTEVSWGNRSIKQVIFTFDAGSGNQSLQAILNTLAGYNVEGSFFITGAWAEKYPNDLHKIAANGHAIYNHTYSHPHLKPLSDQQIKDELHRTDTIIQSIVGFDSKPYFRAPYGERDARILGVAASQGYRHVYWTIDAWDWKTDIQAQQVQDRILSNLQPGTIYLMHVGDAITGQILPDVFKQMYDKGYIIKSLEQGL